MLRFALLLVFVFGNLITNAEAQYDSRSLYEHDRKIKSRYGAGKPSVRFIAPQSVTPSASWSEQQKRMATGKARERAKKDCLKQAFTNDAIYNCNVTWRFQRN